MSLNIFIELTFIYFYLNSISNCCLKVKNVACLSNYLTCSTTKMAVLKIIKRSWVDLNFLIGLFWLENNRGSLCIETDKVTSLDVELISLCNNICAKSKIVEPNKYRIKKKFAKSLECKLNNGVINSRKLFNSSSPK